MAKFFLKKMSQITIHKSKISGKINAPASKSASQRAIAMALFADGETVLKNYTACNDSEIALQVIQKLGAKVEKNDTTIKITGGFNPQTDSIFCGESGLSIRMFTPICALHDKEITINATGSLLKRPVDMIAETLQSLDVEFSTNNSFPPIRIKGKIAGGKTKIDGSISSQFLTGMLVALPNASENSVLEVSNLKSTPYIDLTIEILENFGVKIINKNYEIFEIEGSQKFKNIEYNIEGDWSGAAFLLVAGAIGGRVKVKNLQINSKQADKEIITVLKNVGARVEISENEIFIEKNNLQTFKFDATNCPDLFPPLATLAAVCEGVSEIMGVKRLFHKESNRAEVLKNEFQKLGIKIELHDDLMKIYGQKNIKGGTIHSNNDHRIAMAGAVLGTISEKGITIENSESVSKSYPHLYDDIAKIKADK